MHSNLKFIKQRHVIISDLLVFDRGSRGPSTVTLIALLYDATCGGLVDTVIVNVKLLPVKEKLFNSLKQQQNFDETIYL